MSYENISNPDPSRITLIKKGFWERSGVAYAQKFIPDDLIEEYKSERAHFLRGTNKWRSGWNGPCPYLHVPSMKAIATYRMMTQAMSGLIGAEEPGLHLCLTGFQSTERKWHSDSYLNPSGVNDYYIAAWIALEDIHPDSGVFQYVPGSHQWPAIERQKVWDEMKRRGQDPSASTWPSDSQDWVAEFCEDEIKKRDAEIISYVPKKGDVLFWHAYLIHRGSKPIDSTIERKALIAHYSSIHRRPDMPPGTRIENGSYIFNFPGYTEPGETTHYSRKS